MRLEEYIKNNGIESMAVYGMNDSGKCWYRYLEKFTELKHVFGIEKYNYTIENDYEKHMLYEDELPHADAILVIPWKEFDFVKWELYSFVSDNCLYLTTQDFEDELTEV